MKYVIIVPDGCADEPQGSLGGCTPLQVANIPAMDAVASQGIVGRCDNVPLQLPPGSDVANLSLLGYDPMSYYTGRAPLEAIAQGIELGPEDWAVRCNLVTIEDQVMRDFTAGHITTEEATQLMATAQERLGSQQIQFVSGVSYRNLIIYRATGEAIPFARETRTTPPHDLTDQSVLDGYPRGPGSDVLNKLMDESFAVFADHQVNIARRKQGKLPATNCWLWGLGKAPKLKTFVEKYGKRGAMITAVDLLRGLAKLIGCQVLEVPGATGYTDTDYAAKGRAAVDAIKDVDFVFVHVEATDEASHEGDATAKVKALEEIDRHIVGPIHEAIKSQGDYRILVTPDHQTLLRTKTHSHGLVPIAVAGTGIEPDTAKKYDDLTAAKSDTVFVEGWKLMPFFFENCDPRKKR